ncbi:unnamed protein product, partial [Scytosiphon promiscuus]
RRRQHQRRRRLLSSKVANAAAKALLWWSWLAEVVRTGSTSGTALEQAPNTSPWLLRASALQRYLTYDMPLNQVPMIATHNSFNTEEEGVSTSWERVPNQVYSITYQLACLGVRGIELDTHFVEELVGVDGRSEAEATLVCHTRSSTALEIRKICASLRWYLCEALDIYDFGDDTGCAATAPTLKQVFGEISAWMNLPENANELLFIKFEAFTGDNLNLLPDYATEVFGTGTIFGPLDFIVWERVSGTKQWPTTEYLVSSGKRLVLGTNNQEDADTLFMISRDNDIDGIFNEDVTSAVNFRTSTPCSARSRDVSWSRLQGDASTWVLEYSGVVLYELAPGADEFFGEGDVMDVLECGLIPTFDRMDSTLLEATMWSWQEGEPHTYFSSPRAAVAHQDTGRWTSGSASGDEGDNDEIHSYACRDDSSGERGEWVVSSGAAGYYSAAELVCLAQGLVFGCPRTAKENTALRDSMADASVESVWLNLISVGGDSASTWTRESGVSYTLPTTYTHATCDGGGYSAAADFTWDAEDAWIYGDLAFFEKAERIKGEAQAIRDQATALYASMQQDGSSAEGTGGEDSTDVDEMKALKAAAMLGEADWLENAAREAGAYPKGW